jgi:hypothetical protein
MIPRNIKHLKKHIQRTERERERERASCSIPYYPGH